VARDQVGYVIEKGHLYTIYDVISFYTARILTKKRNIVLESFIWEIVSCSAKYFTDIDINMRKAKYVEIERQLGGTKQIIHNRFQQVM